MSDQFKPTVVPFIEQKLGTWDSIEANPVARAILLQTFSLGGAVQDAAALLTQRLGQQISRDALRSRINSLFKGDSLATYTEMLQQRPVTDEVMSEQREHVLHYLMQSEHSRTQLWRYSTETRAIAVYMLRAGQTPGMIAMAVSRHMGLKPRISLKVVAKSIERAGGRDAFIGELIAGYPPFTKPLTPEELDAGKRDENKVMPVVTSRLRERANWMQRDDTRAFVLSLIANKDVTLHMIPWAVTHVFGISGGHVSSLPRKIKSEHGTTIEEKRAAFVASRRIGIPDDLFERMKELGKQAQGDYFEHLRNVLKRASELGRISKIRAKEMPERSAFEPLRVLADRIQKRSTVWQETMPQTSATLRYTRTPGSVRSVATVFIGINTSGSEEDATLFHHYVQNELREIQSGYSSTLKDALMATDPHVESIGRVMLRGPKADDFEVYTLPFANESGGR